MLLFFVLHRSVHLLGPGRLERVASCIAYPVLRIRHMVVEPVYGWLAHRAHRGQLDQLVSALRQKVEQLHEENVQLQAERDYWSDIREMVDFKRRYSCSEVVVAAVLDRSFSSARHEIIVDKGGADGVQVNDVAVYKKTMVGRVVSVYRWYSIVQLITDPKSRIAAYCRQGKVRGIIAGTGATDTLSFTHVSHLLYVRDGDAVITSGEGLVFPRGFSIGAITSHQKGELFYDISVAPAVESVLLTSCVIIPQELVLQNGSGKKGQ